MPSNHAIDHLVSIIVPVYNVSMFLSEAINSILSQTYNNLEIIVIDDGSDDGSSTICDYYSRIDRRINVVHQNNQGLSAARNAGLDLITGDCVMFLDSDDAFHPRMIQTMLEIMISEGADIVKCGYDFHFTSNRMTPRNASFSDVSVARVYDRKKALRALVDGEIYTTVWSGLYKSDLWKDIRFPVGHVYEDRDTMFRVINLCKKACVLNENLYLHRIRRDSITNKGSYESTRDSILAHTHFIRFIEENTPDIYDEEHLKRVKCGRLSCGITQYARLPLFTSHGKDTQIRKEVIALGNNETLKGSKFRVRLYWVLFRYFPFLLKLSYRIYYPIVWSIRGMN